MPTREDCRKKVKYLENQIGLLSPAVGENDHRMLDAVRKITSALEEVLQCHFEVPEFEVEE
jgi:hypothetical protein